MMRPAALLASLLGLLLVGAQGARADSTEAAQYLPSAADVSAASLLVQARSALARIGGSDGELAPVDRETSYNSAIDALTALYQLHGCEWALAPLLQLRAAPDCPDTHIGWSADGRVSLLLQRMELRNPAFENYTLMLCTLSSNTALSLEGPLRQPLRIELLDGRSVQAEPLTQEHPLWEHLKKLAGTFEPQGQLNPVAGLVFKQIFALRELAPGQIARVESDWGKYRISVPYFENLDSQ